MWNDAQLWHSATGLLREYHPNIGHRQSTMLLVAAAIELVAREREAGLCQSLGCRHLSHPPPDSWRAAMALSYSWPALRRKSRMRSSMLDAALTGKVRHSRVHEFVRRQTRHVSGSSNAICFGA